MAKELSKKRRLAVDRNRIKWRLKGMKMNDTTDSLTLIEKLSISTINAQIDKLLEDWDNQSIELGLKPKQIYEIRDYNSNRVIKTTKDINEVKQARKDSSVLVVKQKNNK